MVWQNSFVCKWFRWTKVWHFDWKPENAGIKSLNDQKVFTECSNTMDDVY